MARAELRPTLWFLFACMCVSVWTGGACPAGGPAIASWAAEHGAPGVGPVGGNIWSPGYPSSGPVPLFPVSLGLECIQGGVPGHEGADHNIL